MHQEKSIVSQYSGNSLTCSPATFFMAGKVMLQTCVRVFFFGRDCFGGAAFFLSCQGLKSILPRFFPKNFRLPKMEVLNLTRLFWGFPLALHATYIGFRIPPFSVPEMFGELSCL